MSELLTLWSDSAALSAAIWLVLAMTILYFGRPHAHQLLRNTGRAVDQALRLASNSLRQLEQRVSARNRDILLAQGREATEHAIEREFTRVKDVVDRELAHYPELHRRLADTLERVEADYQASTHNAPLPPEWSEVTQTIAALPNSGDPAVNKILNEIKASVDQAHKESLRAYQKNTQERHKILGRMAPHWRSLDRDMQKVGEKISGLEAHARTIDRHMDHYESLRNGEDRAVHTLTASSLTQFFIATLVVGIAAFGGLINFHLIALPMSEMVGSGAYFVGMPMSDIAALVIILVEISMGIFLLESLRITRLFPMIGRMDDRMRKRMGIAALTILVIFAGIEASLAYLRDLLILDQQALTQSLAGSTAVVESQFRWIPSIAQMLLGFVLPFALAFVAIPLESFIHSLRTVLGLLTVGLLRAARVVLRVAGRSTEHVARVLVNLYDLFVMIPLGLERMVSSWRQQRARAAETDAAGEAADAAEADQAAESATPGGAAAGKAGADAPEGSRNRRRGRGRSRKGSEPTLDELEPTLGET